MEFKGTLGKWFQAHRKSKHGEYSTEVFCENGETICTLAWYPKPKEKAAVNGKLVLTTGTYREANAKLISKAPEMFELLKEIYDEDSLSSELETKILKLLSKITD